MRGVAAGAIGLALWLSTGVRADDVPKARALVDRAIRALGGEANLRKAPAVSWKGKGIIYFLPPQGNPYTSEMVIQWPNRRRLEAHTELGTQKMNLLIVLNGDEGWTQFGNGSIAPMGKTDLRDQKEELYADYLATVLPLTDPAFKLTAVGSKTIDGRPAEGVKVSRQGHHDVTLYFDKQTGLPLMRTSHYRYRDPRGLHEGEQDTYFADFVETDGVKYPRKFTIKRAGKVFVQQNVLELKPLARVDAKEFAEP